MPTRTLKLKEKISFKQASDKIHAFAKFSNHSNAFRPKSGKELGKWFRDRGINPDELIEECRDPKKQIPGFENPIGTTWKVSTFSGGSVAITNQDEIISEIKGDGMLVMSNCTGHFEAACAARNRAITENSHFAFYESLSQGFASIEALLNEVSENWNKNGGTPPLIDSHDNKVSFETKLNEWVPLITNGGKIDKTGRNWSDFKRLKKLRDEEAIHPSSPSRGINYKELAKNINVFRFGIAFFLGNLHVTFGMHVPAIIINAIYYPDVELCDDK